MDWKIIYLNCGERYEFMIDHRSYTHNLSNCEIKALKNIQAWTGFGPMTSAIPVQCSTVNWVTDRQGGIQRDTNGWMNAQAERRNSNKSCLTRTRPRSVSSLTLFQTHCFHLLLNPGFPGVPLGPGGPTSPLGPCKPSRPGDAVGAGLPGTPGIPGLPAGPGGPCTGQVVEQDLFVNSYNIKWQISTLVYQLYSC